MAMQRHDLTLPSSEYPRLDGGYFSATMGGTVNGVEYSNQYIGSRDQLFFGGSVHGSRAPQRQVISLLQSHPDIRCMLSTMTPEYIGTTTRMTFVRPYNYQEYLQIATQYRAQLALEGTSGFCSREFDALRMGAPLIMSPWRFSHRMEPLVDGVHYFAAEYDSNIEIFAERILRRFNEIRYDQKKRDQVRLNGQQWFERNCTIPHITAKIVEWIESAFANTHPLV